MNHFELLGTRAFFRPTGPMAMNQGVELVAAALARARDLALTDILVNSTGLTGIESPGIFERYAMMTRWARIAGSALRIALVARPAFIDHQKIGVVIAQNRGASIEVFGDEIAALRWLEARRARSAAPRWSALGCASRN
jgi:hypothetical protein